jgi:putative transposase
VASHLSRTRDKTAAKAFFCKALKQHGEPRTISLDGFEPSHSALRIMGMRNEYNRVEQDHRLVKFRTQPMLDSRPSTTRDEF